MLVQDCGCIDPHFLDIDTAGGISVSGIIIIIIIIIITIIIIIIIIIKYCHAAWSGYIRGFGLDLLATYTHDWELEAITAPPLISTIHKSPQNPLSLFQPAVPSPAVP
jgi:hypothetical protein